jgi:hypothetical protein
MITKTLTDKFYPKKLKHPLFRYSANFNARIKGKHIQYKFNGIKGTNAKLCRNTKVYLS